MTDRILKTMAAGDGHRVLLVERTDGRFSYRRQWLDDGGHWGAPGPYCGIYDSLDVAEKEALSRIAWPTA
jgi:hypothetical protein